MLLTHGAGTGFGRRLRWFGKRAQTALRLWISSPGSAAPARLVATSLGSRRLVSLLCSGISLVSRRLVSLLRFRFTFLLHWLSLVLALRVLPSALSASHTRLSLPSSLSRMTH